MPGDKPFLADEIAAEESGVPLPSMQVSDAAYSDEVTPEEEAALAFYASSAAADVSGDPVVEPRDADAADDGDDHHVEADPVDEPQASAEVAEADRGRRGDRGRRARGFGRRRGGRRAGSR